MPSLKPFTINILHALSILCFSLPLASQAQQATDLGAVNASNGGDNSTTIPAAAKTAPSQGSLDARSAQSTVSDEFVRNFISPIADYSQVIQMAPGMFSYSPNGVGLGDNKTTMRGYSDSNSIITFDGIPFNDTNGVSHHAWVFFPSQFTGGAVIDRSPGSAATIGQATFSGSINLLSRNLEPQQRTSLTGSYGTWNTSLIGAEYETGQFGTDGSSNLLINAQHMKSDGYQTFNKQKRDATSLKYQYIVSDNTVLTVFASYLNLKNNTPNIKGGTRANVVAGHYNALLQNIDPTLGTFVDYNFYNIHTYFDYVGINSDLGGGWKLEDKAYIYRYYNKQNYNNGAGAITTSSAIDKLNSYITQGNLLRVSQESEIGTLRTGLWTDYAKSYRFQIPSNPKTWIDQSAPNFSERYKTTTVQPYVEYEFNVSKELKVTPGIKYASYKQDFGHLQDNGGAVGPLGGVFNKATGVITGGAPSVSNSVKYTDVLPSLDAHYQLQKNWSAYAQFAAGDQIPSTSVFDVPGAKVKTIPDVTKSKTYQVGTVYKSDAYTLDIDVYHTKLDSPYSSSIDPVSGNPVYFLNGKQINKGVEAESNIILGSGFSLYLNGTVGSAKYDTGMWVAGAPADTETLGLNFQQDGWDTGLFAKRVGKVYADNGSNHQAFTIEPVVVTNLFVNYTIKNLTSYAKQVKLQLGVNNLLNKHSIVDVASAGTKTSSSAAPSPADLLTVLPARSVSATVTLDF